MLVRTLVTDTTAGRSYYLDYVQLEVGIDPIYEPGGITIDAGTATSGFVSDLIGTNTTDVTPDDSAPLTIQMPSANNAASATFIFGNIENIDYNSNIVMANKIKVSNTALTFHYSVYNNYYGL